MMDPEPDIRYHPNSIDEESRLDTLEPRNKVTFDHVLQHLGEFGKYQKILYYLYALPYIFTSTQLVGWVFIGVDLPHRCLLPGENFNQADFEEVNSTQYTIIDSCTYLDNELNKSYNCHNGYVYDTSIVQDSVIKDWDLVCDKKDQVAAIEAAPMVGFVFGGLTLGSFSDKFGRKPAFLLSDVLMLLSGLVTAFSTNYWVFMVSRMIGGLALAGIEAAAFVMGMELVGPSKRTEAGVICWFFETGGYLMALSLAYVIKNNWRLLQVFYSAPCALFIAYMWYTPESIRWLMTKGRKKEVTKLIKKTAEINDVTIPRGLIEDMERTMELELIEERKLSKNYSIFDLFRGYDMCAKTLIMTLGWVVCSGLYYIMLLDQSEISDDPFIGFFVMCLSQIPGYVFILLTLDHPKFGRKKSLSVCLIIAGITTFYIPFGENYYWFKVSASFIGRFCAHCAYVVLHLYATELFPTVVRGLGMGYCYIVSRIGSILAPYIFLLGWLSPVIFGISSTICGVICLMLPETSKQDLPETLEDGKKFPVIRIF